MIGISARRIVKFALAQRWAVVAGALHFVGEGALLAYTAGTFALYRCAAYYVDRILKGTKRGDLPIEQPMTFAFAIPVHTENKSGSESPGVLHANEKQNNVGCP